MGAFYGTKIQLIVANLEARIQKTADFDSGILDVFTIPGISYNKMLEAFLDKVDLYLALFIMLQWTVIGGTVEVGNVVVLERVQNAGIRTCVFATFFYRYLAPFYYRKFR